MVIHIVEDDPGVSDSLAVVLQQMGHERVSAHSSAESFFDHAPPSPDDTIIVDLALPGIRGEHVVRWLQSLARPPRVIVISGQPEAQIRHALRGMTVRALLRKPLTRESVAGVL